MANKIILGTVQFGLDYGINNTTGKPAKEVVFSILNYAYLNGIKLLDTAEAYGTSQEVIGNYHKLFSNKFNVITKFSSKRNDLSENLTERISQNLQTLNIDFLYGYMFHSFSDFETYYVKFKNEIEQLKKSGIIKKFGVSIYTNLEFEKLLKFPEIDLVQLPFNLLDNTFQRADLISRAKDQGIEVHTRSVFLQGLFFKEEKNIPPKLTPLIPYVNSARSIAKNIPLSINDLSLNYVIQQKNIDYVLIGVDNLKQLDENIISLKHCLSHDTMDKIDKIEVKEVELLNPSNWN